MKRITLGLGKTLYKTFTLNSGRLLRIMHFRIDMKRREKSDNDKLMNLAERTQNVDWNNYSHANIVPLIPFMTFITRLLALAV